MRTWQVVALWAALAAGAAAAGAAEWGTLSAMHDYAACFGLDPAAAPAFRVTLLASSAPGNVFHEGETPRFTFQVENLTDEPLRAAGKVDLVRYAQANREGDMWWPELRRLEACGETPLAVDLPPKGWQDLTLEPRTPETKGGYGLVLDLGRHGRRFLTSYVRTFKPALERVQFPKQALEDMPPEILARLGVQAVRYGVSYLSSDDPRLGDHLARLDREFQAMHANLVTCLAEIGAGSRQQPLGRGRPHLDDQGVMQGGKEDLAWLPAWDDDYEKFAYDLAAKYGWPKGPITGFDLWNEPWEGLSISGWGADMIRYRELYKRLGDAVFRARREAGVDVLVGGCDSSSNTWDKLFPDGRDTFLPYLDFCSIHYQGLAAPVLYPEWRNRAHYKGRVLIWDTESWVANSDDRFAGVVATNRAAGYDRAMGSLSRIAISTMSHGRVAYDTVRAAEGPQKRERAVEARPLAAAYGAVQHFLGERGFREILFPTGLPWVYVFDGLGGRADDGTVVVVGDVAALFGRKGSHLLFHTVRSLEEVRAQERWRAEAAAMPAGAPERAALLNRLATPQPLVGAYLALDVADAPVRLYDFYGNPVPAKGGRIEIPLDDRSFFLRADPGNPGSFAALLEALRRARVAGLEPLEMIPYDMTAPVDGGAVVRVRLTSMLNHPVRGRLRATLGDLRVECPADLAFEGRERKWIDVRVVGGRPRADNAYPLALRFDAGDDGVAVHEEAMHVNLVSRRTIEVDGRLDDWKGALPQTIQAAGPGGPSLEEAMWLPFQALAPGASPGFAVGYLSYDDKFFYFAAKIADDTPHPGTIRYARRDPDADFYPEVCTETVTPRPARPKPGQPPPPAPAPQTREHRWPEGVRRFSYRRWPDLPSSYNSRPFDNVLLGFNAIPIGEDGWLSHLPGRMPGFVAYKSTDYQYALNRVADAHGGGTEVWRLEAPGMPRKHFYPRQPAHPLEGAVEGARLVVRYEPGTRLVECALPWAEIPHVRALLGAGKTVKFSFRVNHDSRGPDMELAAGRASCEGLSKSFHPDWAEHWPNELEFAFEK